MLELQKITELEKPTKFDKFKKSIKSQNEVNKEIKSLDFFKTSRRKKKNTLFDNLILFLIVSIYINFCVGDIIELSNKKSIDIKVKETYELYSQMSSDIDKKNTLDIYSYQKLKSMPTSSADLFSSIVVTKILYKEKFNADIKKQVLKIYSENYNSGTEQEKASNTCTISLSCYINSSVTEKSYQQIEDELIKTAIFARHPDIFQKYKELAALQFKHQVRISQ